MKKVIVTGASGFVGAALCKALSEEGISVIAIVRRKVKSIDQIKDIPNIKIVYCNLSDFRNLSNYIQDRDVDVLYHLAWVGSSGPLRGDVDVQMKNIQYTCDTVRACADIGCKRFIFASSIMEYEIAATMETELTPEINTLYSSAKVATNYIVRTIAGTLGIDYIRAIISNIYGPGETSQRLINTSLRKLLRREHCAFSAGEQIYDFIYITDAVKSFIAIAKSGVPNRNYYIGTENPKPLKEFLLEMRDMVDPKIKIGLGEIPVNGVSLTYKEFDVQAVRNDTGFVPSVSFKEGIKKTIEWIREMEQCQDLSSKNLI